MLLHKLIKHLLAFLLLCNAVCLSAQYQQFELDIDNNSTYRFNVYEEIKEQLGNDGWGEWEKNKFSLELKGFENSKNTLSFQVCYSNSFLILFSDSLVSDSSETYCYPVIYEIDSGTLKLESIPNLKLKSLRNFSHSATYFVNEFSMKNSIERHLLGVFAANTFYTQMQKSQLVRTGNSRLFGMPDAVVFTERSEILGNFNEDPNVKEIHIVRDFEIADKFFKKYEFVKDLNLNQSSHVAFNRKLKILDVFQELKAYSFFFKNTYYDLSFHFMITRKN